MVKGVGRLKEIFIHVFSGVVGVNCLGIYEEKLLDFGGGCKLMALEMEKWGVSRGYKGSGLRGEIITNSSSSSLSFALLSPLSSPSLIA